MASTNDAYCPTLKGRPQAALADGGRLRAGNRDRRLSFAAIRSAMRAALHAATAAGGEHGLVRVTAGNYGGKLGRHHFHLRELVS